MNNKYLVCHCCGNPTVSGLGDYEICELCGWEDDPVQSEDPDYEGGANELSLNQAKKIWQDKLNRSI